MDVKLSQIIQEVAEIKRMLADIVGNESRVKGSVEISNLEIKYSFPNVLKQAVPKNTQEIVVKGSGVNWAAEIRSKLLKLRQVK